MDLIQDGLDNIVWKIHVWFGQQSIQHLFHLYTQPSP